MIYFILVGYVLPVLINSICLYKDESVKTIGDFVEYSWVVVIPFINLFVMFLIPLTYIFGLLENKFNIQTMWKKLMNKKIKNDTKRKV
jgi:hypothetical protein